MDFCLSSCHRLLGVAKRVYSRTLISRAGAQDALRSVTASSWCGYSLKAVAVGYLIWMFTADRRTAVRGGRPVLWLRRLLVWRWMRDYFPITLIRKGQYDRRDKYIIAIHPHGIVSFGAWGNFIVDNQALGEVDYRLLTVSFNFMVPIWRDFLLSMGLIDARRSSVAAALRRGISVAVVVGGAKEALDSRPGTNDLTLERRLGFIRLALEHGAKLVPVYSFGETDVFGQLVANPPGSLVRWLQERFLAVFGFTIPLVSNLVPYRRPITTVIGEALDVPHKPDPTLEDIMEVHHRYVGALQQLYDDYKNILYTVPHEDLKIVDRLADADVVKLAAELPAVNSDEPAYPLLYSRL